MPTLPVEVAAVAIATLDDMRERIRRKSRLKGRQVDEQSVAEVRAMLGEPPPEGHRRDLLIDTCTS